MCGLPTGTVTLLFTDIEGSTRLPQQLGERYAGVLEECRQLFRTAFHTSGGHEVDTQGDAFLVAFARATDAASAAVAIQRALFHHVWPEGVTVRVRMGLHTGESSLATEGYVGLDVHHAARIMSAGHGGQVLLSQAMRDLVAHDLPAGVSLRDLGEHRLKDLGHPNHLYQLVIAGLTADFPPLTTLDSRPNNLPVQPTPLLGRDQDVAAVVQLLQRSDVRLVTLSGPGGSGKTRLGIQVAAELCDRFAAGAFFVNLAPTSDSTLVVPTIAQTLGVREVTGQPTLQVVQEMLRQRQMLLLLDNFEQVADAALEVAELLAACPQLKVITTSREALHVRGEHEFAVSPLALPDLTHLPDPAALSHCAAVTLFLQQAQASKPDFQLTTANARAVAEICVRLDGLPLAIELAAARIKHLPPQALLARLGQRLAVLTSGARDAPARQRTLRSTLRWSYDLLNTQEQHLFRWLSVFVGGCTLEAVEATYRNQGNETTEALDLVASLIDKSLVRQTAHEGEEPRFEMLETVREYGLECLHESREAELSQHAHAECYLSLAERVEPHLRGGGEQLKWLTLLKQDQENLRAALRWFVEHEETERALRLSGAIWWYWFMNDSLDEMLRWLEAALVLPNSGMPTASRAQVLAAAGLLIAFTTQDFTRARVRLEESMALYQELGERRGYAHALQFLGDVYLVQGDYATARPFMEQGLALCRELGDDWKVAYGLNSLGIVMSATGETATARVLWEECLTLTRKIGERWALPRPLGWLAGMLLVQGDYAQTVALAQEGLKIAQEYGDKSMLSALLALQAGALIGQDDVQAANLVQEGLAIGRDRGDQEAISIFLCLMGDIALHQGHITQANDHYRESLSLAQKLAWMQEKKIAWMQETVGRCLLGLARVARTEGRIQSAARLFGAAEPWLNDKSDMHPGERATYDSAVAEVRAHLGKEAFAAIWTEGQTMTPEQALAVPEPMMMSQLLADQPRIAQIPKTHSYPAGLTAREVEVLRLVAQGLSDAQVAEQLVISPRTVNSHLTSIYNKLGVDSRAAATRFAVEHQLA